MYWFKTYSMGSCTGYEGRYKDYWWRYKSVYTTGIQSGEKIKIPNKGYKDGKGGRGDLVAEVKIMVPKNLELDEKEMFEKLKDMSTFNPRN